MSNSADSPARNRPHLALLAMNVIAEHSILEAFFMNLFIEMLGNNPRPAAAMYAALNSDKARKDAVRAVARASLSQQELDILESLFSMLDAIAKTRNKLAHWTWGHSPELPEHVLLINPEDHAQNSIGHREESDVRDRKFIAAILKGDEGAELTRPIPSHKGIFAFDEKDLLGASASIQNLINLVSKFQFVLKRGHPSNHSGKLLRRLLAEPEVHAFVSRLLERRKKTQEEHQQQPQKPGSQKSEPESSPEKPSGTAP